MLLQVTELSQVLKTEGTRPMMMCSFFETVLQLGYDWLEGQVKTTALAVLARMWKDALSAYGDLQKLLLLDLIMLVKVHSVLEWLISFPTVALWQCKPHLCGAYSHSGSV